MRQEPGRGQGAVERGGGYALGQRVLAETLDEGGKTGGIGQLGLGRRRILIRRRLRLRLRLIGRLRRLRLGLGLIRRLRRLWLRLILRPGGRCRQQRQDGEGRKTRDHRAITSAAALARSTSGMGVERRFSRSKWTPA